MYIYLFVVIFTSCPWVSTLKSNAVTCKNDQCSFDDPQFVFQVDCDILPALIVARCMNASLVSLHLSGFYLLRPEGRKKEKLRKRWARCTRSLSILWKEEQKPLIRSKRSIRSINWNDPLYSDMWYITRGGGSGGYDMNVQEAWQLGYTGKGVVLTIIDDGIDHTHKDLKKNYDPQASYDLIENDPDPMPNLNKTENNKHGTRCAGQIAAQANNSVCMVGIAYNARIGGIRMLDGHITDIIEANTLAFRNDYIHIYSGSWGPEDTGKLYEGPGVLAQSAFQEGIVSGRNGFGNIYVWASGNGGVLDSCACDGYASSLFTLSVSGVGENNGRPWYLEQCTSTLATTYSSGSQSEKMIVTVDPQQKCTTNHTGTSASAPMAAGIVALLLEANPRLSWRDVQYVTVLTSNPLPFVDGNFTVNAVGRAYSSFYGYGLMDAGKMVRLGELWRGLPPHHQCTSDVGNVKLRLIGSFNHTFALNFSGCQPMFRTEGQSYAAYARNSSENGRPVRYLEHVQLHADIMYQRRGMLQITLISPSGTETVLQPTRSNDEHSGDIGLLRLPLTTVQLWGESAVGTWKVRLDNQADLRSPYLLRPYVDKLKGYWRSFWIVAYGTEEFPIRLRPPVPERPPPPDWFALFSKYVVHDAQWHKVYTCHAECATGGCTGPAADECLGGCRHFATESRQCVSTCPLGTTPYGALRVSLPARSDQWITYPTHRNRLKPGRIRSSDRDQTSDATANVVCQPCWTLCAACVRPHTEYDCTACSNGRFLVPLITPPPDSSRSSDTDAELKISNVAVPSLAGTCRADCPVGFYGNKSSSTCNRCMDNCAECFGPNLDDCSLCRPGFRLIHGRCVDGNSVDGRCTPGQFLENSRCIDCDSGCEPTGCLTGGQCNRCKSDFRFLFNSTCVKSCPVGWFPGIQLPEPFVVGSALETSASFRPRQCEPCGPGCLTCSSEDSCINCASGLNLRDGQCVDSNHSIPCDPRCRVCYRSADDCLNCVTDHSLVSIVLLEQIRTRSHLLSAGSRTRSTIEVPHHSSFDVGPYVCFDTCPQGTYPSQDISEPMCLPCSAPCLSCLDKSRCTACWPPFYFSEQTSSCLLGASCRQSEYYDPEKKLCLPCHPTCSTCNGPTPSDCTSCSTRGDSPRCLQVPNSIRWRETAETPTGQCMSCCAYKVALVSRTPTNCMFCIADRSTCLSGTEINAGEGLLIDPVPVNEDNAHVWLLSEPSRVVLLLLCATLLVGAAVFIIAHATRVCRQRYDPQTDTAAVRQRRRRGLSSRNYHGEADDVQMSLKLGEEPKEGETLLIEATTTSDLGVGVRNGNSARTNACRSTRSTINPDNRAFYVPLKTCPADNSDYSVDDPDGAICTTHIDGEYCTRTVRTAPCLCPVIQPSGSMSQSFVNSPNAY